MQGIALFFWHFWLEPPVQGPVEGDGLDGRAGDVAGGCALVEVEDISFHSADLFQRLVDEPIRLVTGRGGEIVFGVGITGLYQIAGAK